MKKYVQAHGFDVWQSVVDRYKEPITPPTYNDGKKLSQNNSTSKNSLSSVMVDSVYVKVMNCDSAKEN
jgi:hypothetical protein